MTIRHDLVIESVNTALLELTGAPSESVLIGRNLAEFPVSAVDQFPAVRAAVAAGEGVELEAAWKSVWGHRVEVRIHIGPVFAEDGSVAGAQAIVEDISEKKRLAEELRQSQKMEAMGRLASGVAHDFRNDLTAILGYADLMRADLPEGGPLSESLAQIVQAAERSASICQQLLAFGQTQLGDLQLVRPCQLIEDLTPVLERICGPGVRLELELSDPRSALHLNAGQFEMGLINLVTNARDAMPRGGRLGITCRALRIDGSSAAGLALDPGRYVELVIRDDGHGMDSATRSRVFEPFFTTKAVGMGTGLGLATLHRFVAQSGGAIEVESDVEAGTAFRILLPAADSAADLPQGVESACPTGSETLLWVEGPWPTPPPAQATLEASGYRVERAEGLDAAIARAEEGSELGLVLYDIDQHAARGAGFMARLRGVSPDLPVLLLARDGVAAGFYDRLDPNLRVLGKPFTAEELGFHVRELLEKRFVARHAPDRGP